MDSLDKLNNVGRFYSQTDKTFIFYTKMFSPCGDKANCKEDGIGSDDSLGSHK